MEPMVAIFNPVGDEVLQTAVQYGIKNILVYGGPGTQHMSYQDYVTMRMRIESFGLKLAAIEGGFAHGRDFTTWYSEVPGRTNRSRTC